jgi:alpha-D-ribose 1-methylphosphonate 5-triphosphate synthase subunit PhnH
VSFIAQNNRKALNTDFKDAVLQGRKMFRYALVAALVCGVSWVLVESAHALSMF